MKIFRFLTQRTRRSQRTTGLKQLLSPLSALSAASASKVVLLFLLFILSACSTVPYTGRHSMMLVSEKEEKKMGEEAYAQTLKESKLNHDPEKVAMLDRVGERLAKAADKPDFKWEFNLIEDDKTVNAWCLPGGKIAVYTGLLPISQDETGLAVVLGHEISHALARHGSERMSQQMVLQTGGKILSIVTGTQSPLARDAFNKAYGIGAQVGVALPHSRANESEADHIGLILMAKAGYDPRKALEFWKRMEAVGGGKDDAMRKFMSTHPSDKDRQVQIEKEIPEALKFYKPE